MPPGTTKSKLILEAYPAWLLGRDPTRKIICISNSSELAEKSSLLCRDIIRSEWYQKHFPHVVIADDKDTKMSYKTTMGGYRVAKPVQSNITGHKGDYLLIDDPNDAEKVMSYTLAESVKSWYDRGLHDRVVSFVNSCRVAMAQRTGMNDLIGHLVANYGYEYFFMPEEFEPERRFTSSIGWTDWRTELGELLRPERFGPKQVEIGRRRPDYQSKHQQSPETEEQAFFKREYFRLRWHFGHSAGQIVLPSGDDRQPDYRFDASACLRFATIDAAAAAKTSADHTACVVFVLSPRGDLVILDCILRQVDIPDQPKVLAEIQAKHAPPVIGIERCGANAAMYQFARKLGYSAVALDPGKDDKLVRANAAIMRASEGGIWLPADGLIPDFDVPDFISELVMFRGDGKGRDDRVDCLVYAFRLMPMLPSLSRGNQFRPTAVDATGGGSRMPMGAVPIPPVGGVRAGSPAPAGMGGGGFRPSVIRPGSPFGR